MSEFAIPYVRNEKASLIIYEDGSMEHKDICPGCGDPVTWLRECEEWTVLDDDTDVPSLWTAWHTYCKGCGDSFVDPYSDGLVYWASVLYGIDEEDER